jgi:alkaline phosphatase
VTQGTVFHDGDGGSIGLFLSNNDAASFVAEVLDFNDAVGEAISFYRRIPAKR